MDSIVGVGSDSTSSALRLTLTSISDDALAQIVWFLDGYRIFNLWMTGDAHLRRHLEAPPVVRRFALVYPSPRGFVWPSIIHRFAHVEDVCLEQGFEDVQLLMGGIDLRMLPRTVKRLDFDFFSSFLALWLPSEPGSGILNRLDIRTMFPQLEVLRFREAKEADLMGDLRYLSSGLPPSLHTLQLDLGPGFIYNAQFLDDLPQTLSTLTLKQKGKLDADVSTPYLPASLPPLTRLDLSSSGYIDISKLPRTLLHLSLEIAFDLVRLDTLFPPLLESFSYTSHHPLHPQFLDLLPTSITDLKFNKLAFFEWSRFKRLNNLKRLDLTTNSDSPPLNPEIHQLPPSLTSLRISTLKEQVYTEQELTQNSPNSLRNLGRFHVIPSTPISCFPRYLESLSLFRPISDDDVKHLPTENLRFLQIPLWKLSEVGWTRLRDRALRLETLEYTLGDRQELKSHSLPTLISWDEEGQEYGSYRLPFLSLLPSSITRLYIELPEHPIWEISFADFVTGGLQSLRSLDFACVAGFSENNFTLMSSGCQLSWPTSSSSSSLPLSAAPTGMATCGSIDNSHRQLSGTLSKFPRTLEHFRARKFSVSMSCVEMLGREFPLLRSLELKQLGLDRVNDQDLARLPRTLTHLSITSASINRDITLAGLSQLPPFLICVELPPCLTIPRHHEIPMTESGSPPLPPFLQRCVFSSSIGSIVSINWVRDFITRQRRIRTIALESLRLVIPLPNHG